MSVSPLFFYPFAILAIAFAMSVVLKKNPVSSAFSLVMVFFAFAGIYALLEAHLIAALQVLVYAGAIMVLFLFVIMLLSADVPSLDMVKTHPAIRAASLVIGLTLLAAFVWIFKESALLAPMGLHSADKVAAAGGNTRVLSQLMFSEYILPFELTSILLLAGIVGSVALAKRKPVQGAAKGARK